jgi:hypothetical protein
MVQLAEVAEIAVRQRILVPSVDDQDGRLPCVVASALVGEEDSAGDQTTEYALAASHGRIPVRTRV